MLHLKGFKIGRRHVATLMRTMGLEALYRKKSTSKRNPEHKVYPYLLRGLAIDQPLITSGVPTSSRACVAPFEHNDDGFCIEAVEDAISRYGCPEIFNTDQGSQFTDHDFVKLIKDDNAISLSMDGKGCWRDNVFVERFWRSLKYEEVFLRAYGSFSEAKSSIGRYIEFYNSQRPHSSLDGKTPDGVYFIASAAIAA